MFKRILVANRGEIACRIMRTAHALNVQARRRKCVSVRMHACVRAWCVEEAVHRCRRQSVRARLPARARVWRKPHIKAK